MASREVLKKIEELEKQLASLKLELTQPEPKKSDRLIVGEKVNILNPGRGQESHGKISRIFKNLERR